MNSFKSERRKQHAASTTLTTVSSFKATTGHPAPASQEQDATGLHAGHSLADFTIHHPGESATPIQKVDATQSQGQPDRPEQIPSQERQENQTGLPDALKVGVENLSGYSLDDIRVHYNSSKPAEVQALAYTQGTEIHVGPGQEQHLAHEAWHVVQQKQGRVQATMQMKGVAINDDEGLEREANVMGEIASQGVGEKTGGEMHQALMLQKQSSEVPIVQRKVKIAGKSLSDEQEKAILSLLRGKDMRIHSYEERYLAFTRLNEGEQDFNFENLEVAANFVDQHLETEYYHGSQTGQKIYESGALKAVNAGVMKKTGDFNLASAEGQKDKDVSLADATHKHTSILYASKVPQQDSANRIAMVFGFSKWIEVEKGLIENGINFKVQADIALESMSVNEISVLTSLDVIKLLKLANRLNKKIPRNVIRIQVLQEKLSLDTSILEEIYEKYGDALDIAKLSSSYELIEKLMFPVGKGSGIQTIGKG